MVLGGGALSPWVLFEIHQDQPALAGGVTYQTYLEGETPSAKAPGTADGSEHSGSTVMLEVRVLPCWRLKWTIVRVNSAKVAETKYSIESPCSELTILLGSSELFWNTPQ